MYGPHTLPDEEGSKNVACLWQNHITCPEEMVWWPENWKILDHAFQKYSKGYEQVETAVESRAVQ